jgi:hypothetical protein
VLESGVQKGRLWSLEFPCYGYVIWDASGLKGWTDGGGSSHVYGRLDGEDDVGEKAAEHDVNKQSRGAGYLILCYPVFGSNKRHGSESAHVDGLGLHLGP